MNKVEDDTNVADVCRAFQERSFRGIGKYGVTTDRTDLSIFQWLQHLQEELMDATIYIQKLKKEVLNVSIDRHTGRQEYATPFERVVLDLQRGTLCNAGAHATTGPVVRPAASDNLRSSLQRHLY